VRRPLPIGAALVLVAFAACGGEDETTTVTTTVTGAGATTTGAETTPPAQTTTSTAADCVSKSAPNVSDLSVENMGCKEADALTGEVIQSLSREPFSVAGFECEIRGRSGPESGSILGAEDIRCASGDRSFRFSFGD